MQPLLNVFDLYEHSKFVWERFATAIKIDRIPSFDIRSARRIRHSIFAFQSFLSDQTERSQPADACMSMDSESGVEVKNRNMNLTSGSLLI